MILSLPFGCTIETRSEMVEDWADLSLHLAHFVKGSYDKIRCNHVF